MTRDDLLKAIAYAIGDAGETTFVIDGSHRLSAPWRWLLDSMNSTR
jgi:hypothetical protein